MFVPDEAFPDQLNAMAFMERYNVFSMPTEIILPDPDVVGFDVIRDFDLDHWNAVNLTPAIRSNFPYLERHHRD
jgi:hypothetical protein